MNIHRGHINTKMTRCTIHSPIVSQTYTGPLTFHAELLKTNPVKALRLQAEERGHVNAKWNRHFPPDDVEAQELASTYCRNNL